IVKSTTSTKSAAYSAPSGPHNVAHRGIPLKPVFPNPDKKPISPRFVAFEEDKVAKNHQRPNPVRLIMMDNIKTIAMFCKRFASTSILKILDNIIEGIAM